MNDKQLTENRREVHMAIAQLIVASSLFSCVGYPNPISRTASQQGLRDAANGIGDISSWTFLNVDFRRAGTDVTLTVSIDTDYTSLRSERTDGDGNIYAQGALKVQVNWPCHGSVSPATAIARLHLMQEVALLASEIEATIGDIKVRWITETASQVAERKAKEGKERIDRKVREVVKAHKKGIRKGNDVVITAHTARDLDQIPVGSYNVSFDEPTGNYTIGKPEFKQYTLNVMERDAGIIGLLTREA